MHDLPVPFINNHHRTLESLELPSLYDHLDPYVLLSGLQYFPLLRKVKLDHCFASLKQTSTAGLEHLLKLHTTSLKELTLNFCSQENGFIEHPPPEKWFRQKFLHIRLPNLQSLALGMEYFADDIG
jgi:hypothetical protein